MEARPQGSLDFALYARPRPACLRPTCYNLVSVSSGKDCHSIRGKIRSLLEVPDFEGLAELQRARAPVVRYLLGMTYDKADVISWRAMEAIGRLTAAMPADRVRNIIQRVLWMMRDESGGNPWSAAEVIGEIVRVSPVAFQDIIPVVISFHEEELFRLGVLRAMARMAETAAGLVRPHAWVARRYLQDPRPAVRGNALMALMALGGEGLAPECERMLGDDAAFRFYDGQGLVSSKISSIARECARRRAGK
jgi:hypothetical protein